MLTRGVGMNRLISGCVRARTAGVYVRSRPASVLERRWCSGGENRRTLTTPGPTGTYDHLYWRSINDREAFWDEVGQCVEWHTPYTQVLDNSEEPFTRWYVGGELNICHNAVDRHVSAGRGDQTAIIHDSPVTASVTRMTYSQLLEQVTRLAGGLASLGVGYGDRVMIYMPMVPEAVVAMLATVRLGAIHSLVFGGFAARELATRIDHLHPSVVVSASCGVEPSRLVHYKPMLDEAIELSTHKPRHCVLLQREGLPEAPLTPGWDVAWHDLVATSPPADARPVPSHHPCYVLYTSGTTGQPKGIVRPTGGHAAVLPWTMKVIYGMNPGDVWWAASDLGWIVGHSYICYAPLLNGNTTVIYEGKPVGTPDAGQFFRVVQEHGVKGMFTAPTALRAIIRHDPEASEGRQYNISSLKYLFVAGEPLDHETREWALDTFQVPVLDNWWQTETGYAITAHAAGMGMSLHPPRGATGKPFVGFDLSVITDDGSEATPGELGRIVCRLPLPPGCMSTLHNAPERFVETYFTQYPGYYDTMDAGVRDTQGYVGVRSRDDDVINVAGHRLSTLALEEAMLEHPQVVDVAVVGVPDAMKGEVPLGLFVVKEGCQSTEQQISEELVEVVRRLVGPVAAFRLSTRVKGLPRTRSGKTARKSIAELAQDKAIKIPPTIEDPSVYDDILMALRRRGFALNAPDPIKP
ncbi:acyl-CoA synthetase short-chain family member 3, mitochondrial-like [Homarus americanus]|uniref:acyl-CoA synthetase short-chain family member 3, mitochondrial-like n=1 Tax=Homarus americanus TaxID=6706 RepID=UPI001C48E2A9|nr:acyl-CoA synthetase short-chain family member 3, mitochondrial-like [Homarus americanus]